MNGRLFVKRLVGSVLLLIGVMCFFTDVEFGTKVIAFAMCAAMAWPFLRKTYRDRQEEIIRRCRNGEVPEQVARYLSGELPDSDVAEAASGTVGDELAMESRARDPGRTARRLAVGATALHVAAGPFIILAKLLKMQE